MALQLDHTIVPAYDKVKSAEFIAKIFGLEYKGPYGHFAPVKINEKLTARLRRPARGRAEAALEPLRLPRLRRGV